MTDCNLCREWELCPFHPKELEPESAEDAEPATLPNIQRTQVVSKCGHYLRTYVNGVCIDEEPID